jgi:hypothetical protein
MISLRERGDVAGREVVHCESEIGRALTKGFPIEVPVDSLVVKSASVHHREDARKGDVITEHRLSRSNDEQGACQR